VRRPRAVPGSSGPRRSVMTQPMRPKNPIPAPTSECRMFRSWWPGSDSLRTRRGIVRLCARRSVLAYRTRRAVAIGNRRGVFHRAGSARPADLPGPVRGMPRHGDGRHHRTAAGRRGFPLELERASAASLVDKIQKTMPFSLPGTLSRQQSTDLAADILRASKFSAGPLELSDAMLRRLRSLRREPPRPPWPSPRVRLFPRQKATLPS